MPAGTQAGDIPLWGGSKVCVLAKVPLWLAENSAALGTGESANIFLRLKKSLVGARE